MLSQDKLLNFKTNICDENPIITSILVKDLANYFVQPILDVGSGSGDILLKAFPDKSVMHLDRDKINPPDSVSEKHTFIQGDFYEFTGAIGTLFLGHVLQYIDDDMPELIKKIGDLSPQYIVSVTNLNDDLLGDIVKKLDEAGMLHNAERDISDFSDQFRLIEERPFMATMKSDSLESLAEYICMILLDTDEKKPLNAVKEFLTDNIETPEMTINQIIRVFKRV